MIRFENTGTADAINIAVRDIIDITKYDISTLIPLSGSHNFKTKIENGNEVVFYFENINLPFNNTSNDGYVSFKIKTLNTLQIGDSFSNSAEIYFDYNYPIYTNTSITQIATLGINETERNMTSIKLYPNPVLDKLNIKSEKPIKNIKIFDNAGRLIKTKIKPASEIYVKDLKPGIYWISIITEQLTSTQKFIKK